LASYRFCRTDDLALLARACSACAPFAGPGPATVDALKQAARRIDLWTSGCMVALEGDEPVGVVIAAKDSAAACILGVGVRPDVRRRGHGRHLVTSLGAKLSILGPPRLIAEVPAADAVARAFFHACGFTEEMEFADFEGGRAEAGAAPPIVVPVTIDDLVAAGALGARAASTWGSRPAVLERGAEHLRGLAVAAGDRVAAWLLYEPRPVSVVALWSGADGQRAAWSGLLLRALVAEAGAGVRLAGVGTGDVPPDALHDLGFVEIARTIRCAAAARRD
jgi:ribosomal protein S18 acetylase RimI-like enzyme